MMALGVEGAPPPLRRYLATIEARKRRVGQLRDLERKITMERVSAEAALSEAHRDFREVNRKWQELLLLARRVRAYAPARGQLNVPIGYAGLQQQLEQGARDLGISVGAVRAALGPYA